MAAGPAASAPRGEPRAGLFRRRSTLAATAALLLCGAVTACSAGQEAQTSHETPGTAGVDGGVGSMVLDDVFLQTATTVPVGGSVPLRAALTEESAQPDRLLSVSTPVASAVEMLTPDGTPAPSGISVPANGQVDATTGPVLLRLVGVARSLSPQALVPVTFRFQRSGTVTLHDVPAATPRGK